ncbi:MAG: SRPBCC family protein [Acidobacteriota bacterium]
MSEVEPHNTQADRSTIKITITESIEVQRSPDFVWNFTQDYQRRCEWDASVLEATVLHREPIPRIRVRCAGGVQAVFQYKQFDRPYRTSLVMEDVRSWLIVGGGGSWSYAAHNTGTTWTQTNALTVHTGLLGRMLAPFLRYQLRSSTRRAMNKAKSIMESEV